MWGDYGCRWCCSPPISSSLLSGNTVGFHSSTSSEVRHELFKTYFGQWNWEVTCATLGQKVYEQMCNLLCSLSSCLMFMETKTHMELPSMWAPMWVANRVPLMTTLDIVWAQSIPLLCTEPLRFGDCLLLQQKVSWLVLCLRINILINFQINFPFL